MPRDADGISRHSTDDPTAAVTRHDMELRDAAIERIERHQDEMTEQIDQHDQHVQLLVNAAVDAAVGRLEASQLTPEERDWVRLAVRAAGRRERLREVVIEKGILAALGLMCAGIGLVLLDWLRNHGLKV